DGAITWKAQIQKIIALSSTESEYVALCEAAIEAIWLRNFLEELGFPQHEPTIVRVDNQSAMKLARNPEFHKRTKHIEVRFHFSRSAIEQKKITLEYISTEEQQADIFTKPLQKTKFETMREKISVCEVSPT